MAVISLKYCRTKKEKGGLISNRTTVNFYVSCFERSRHSSFFLVFITSIPVQLRVFRILPSLAVVFVRLKNVGSLHLQPVEWSTRVDLDYFMGRLPEKRKKKKNTCGSRFQAEFRGCDFLIEEFKGLKCNDVSEYKITPLKGSI